MTASPKGTGHTLFAPSRLIFQHLPAAHSLATLRPLTWCVSTAAFEATTLSGLPLVATHPSTGQPVLRYHEHWPAERTAFDASEVKIEGLGEEAGREVRWAIERTLYDRRVCARVGWEKGDVLVSDNVGVMHTREAFVAEEGRELWRVHVN